MSQASDFVNACATGLVPGAEQITYTPLGGTAKTIWAVVDRTPPRKDPEAFSVMVSRTLLVAIANDAQLGVVKIDTGGDTVTLPLKIGDAPQTIKVRYPEYQDAGVYGLRCG